MRAHPADVAPVVEQLDRVAGHVEAPRIAVLTDEKASAAAEQVARWRGADAHSFALGRGIEALHVELAALGPFDAVVDLVSKGGRERLRALMLHVRRGGGYVLRLPAPGSPARERLARLVRDLDDAEVAGEVLGCRVG